MKKYDYDEIIIGHSLEAVMEAYKRRVPLFLNSKQRPFRFDKLEQPITLPGFDVDTDSVLEVWSSLTLHLAINGLVPFGTAIEKIVFDKNEMSISIGGGFSIKAVFKDCLIFEDDNLVLENETKENEEEAYRVFDWFNVKSGLKHEFEQLIDNDDRFVNKVYFYKSVRVDGNHDLKDCVTESQIYNKELSEFGYSPTMARFKAEKMMSEKGIRGAKNGRATGGHQKYLSLKIEPFKRSKQKLRYKKYVDSEYVRFAR